MDELHFDSTVYSLDDCAPAPSDRREGERHLTLFRVGAVTVGERRELCLIKNISAGGMKVRPYCDFAEGQRVAIEVKTGMTVPGTVTWLRDGNAGIAFERPIDVVEFLSQSLDGVRPRMPRIEVDCTATVREGARLHQVRVCDVSQGGAKVEVRAPLDVRSEVTFTVPGLETRAASVGWSSSTHAGITFNDLLPLAQLVDWLKVLRDQRFAA